ncbi:MAG: DUF1722 domain-containing protein [Proteobacteria bacterium]|nr:DUF1722 domain-containing protein [Pseudomonadota bacterium]MBU1688807.1 DUF1722 domain-containing protein [Pseudomonadota bacterium]
MRIWDINPGYLNRQSLLGEHRELHGIVSILVNGKKGYSRHPETLRWLGYGWALQQRHRLLAAEMALRGYTDRTPVLLQSRPGIWPDSFIDEPGRQFAILAEKHREREPGRIPFPKDAQQLWSQHKYSVLARDVPLYKNLGRKVSLMKPHQDFSDLANLLSGTIRQQPTAGGLQNALQHMWGYVSDYPNVSGNRVGSWSLQKLLTEIQQRTMANREPYLTTSTALGELAAWLPEASTTFPDHLVES